MLPNVNQQSEKPKTFYDYVEKELNKDTYVKHNNNKIKVSKYEAFIKRLVDLAISGDFKSIQIIKDAIEEIEYMKEELEEKKKRTENQNNPSSLIM